jgi:hypothetical protein
MARAEGDMMPACCFNAAINFDDDGAQFELA